MTMHRTLSVLTVAALVGSCAYEPPLRGKDDRWRNDQIANTLKGSVKLYGPTAEEMTMARGMVLLFDADSPGPPEGTSGPVDFAVIDEFEWKGTPELGFSAEYAFTDVADGEYLVDVILDTDGDFGPTLFTLGGATCGDWQGYHEGVFQTATTVTTSTDTGTMTTTEPVFGKGRVRVEGGQVVAGIEARVEEKLTTERPAFEMASDTGWVRISLTEVGTASLPPTFPIRSVGIHVQYTEDETHRLDLADPCQTDGTFNCLPDTPECAGGMVLYYRDKDGNGVMDPHPDYPPEFGLKDVWPRVLMQYYGEPELDAEGRPVLDENGYPVLAVVPDEEADGFFWGTEAFPFGVESAGFGLALAPLETPTLVRSMDVMFPPLVAKFYDEWNPECGATPPEDPSEGCSVLYDLSDPAQREQVPKGVWGPNTFGFNGQTWGIPNEISELGLAPTTPEMNVPGQGGFVWVVE